ncbi:TetR/AcrR family transcriptional regulator [Flavivirga sp. 57AJ16]|uniref:TetR/AcrR family transcriptional regulator n=1 Tax=Flavivirga sp. 57AJ16 TaxID=3025307 RepID=UPI002365BC6A|nr:TetR/AcrR family transcriptional regulator [Flavivirga sp. 57AJ16]MDD7885072.1 TetR/AcrR family transcriptional regulator [Flavivirga sp. 57AJ16]
MTSMSKADTTRMNILNKAFLLIYMNGYQATSIDEIIATTQVTKGALYYHFKNKDDMGLSIIKEVMYPILYSSTIQPLARAEKPQLEIYKIMRNLLNDEKFFNVQYGCPFVNLVEEMAPHNTSFSNALKRLVVDWKEAIECCIEEGKKQGLIRDNVNGGQVAIFVLSGYSGIRNLGKILGRPCYNAYLKQLKSYLQSLN